MERNRLQLGQDIVRVSRQNMPLTYSVARETTKFSMSPCNDCSLSPNSCGELSRQGESSLVCKKYDREILSLDPTYIELRRENGKPKADRGIPREAQASV